MFEILNKIWLKFHQSLEKISNEAFKNRLQKNIPFLVASLVAGILTVIYSTLFGYAETLMRYLFSLNRLIVFVQAPVLMLAGWWLVNKFAPYAGGSGIPQVMASIELVNLKKNINIKPFLSIKVVFIKIISSILMVMGGAAIGREGPTIQISSSIFDYIYKVIPKSWPKYKRSNIIVAGAAAGLAAAFNTPLGGIVFAIEELSKVHVSFYRSALFIAVIISGLTAQGFLGSYLYLGYPNINGISWFMFVYVIIIAIIGGLLGSILGKAVFKLILWRKQVFTQSSHQVLFILAIALIISTLAYFVSFSITGSGKDLMQHLLFSKNISIKWYDFPLRFTGTLLCFSSGASGGIFAPALSAGAALGGYIGNIFNLQINDTHLIVLVGMVAFLTSITRTPFTSAILVLEMTDRSSVIFYLLVAGIVANFASKLIDRNSLYDHLKIDYLNNYKRKLSINYFDKQESTSVHE